MRVQGQGGAGELKNSEERERTGHGVGDQHGVGVAAHVGPHRPQ